MKKYIYLKPTFKNGQLYALDLDGKDYTRVVREHMLNLAKANDQSIQYDPEGGKCYRRPLDLFEEQTPAKPEVATSETISEDPVLAFIHSSYDLKPEVLKMPELKWKYLVRSAVRGKNIMMTGAAGSGKTMAAKHLVDALDRPHFYFNLGATQDPRSTLIGNTHFKEGTGTLFCESLFVKAIKTEDSIILLDEISRAHPEAWNILMTVLDEGQRYLRLDEQDNSPTIKVAKGVTFVATANIGNEYTATRSMDRALVDRFIIVEMDLLNKEQESGLLKELHPKLTQDQANILAEISSITRREVKSESPKITNSISTRLSVESAGLMEDGFTLGEVAEVTIYPFFDEDGGVDSERTFIKQLVQKYIKTEDSDDLFNIEDDDKSEDQN